ncbi:MAG TPA: hypothetical protein VGE20_02400 [Ramlibacter sp.]
MATVQLLSSTDMLGEDAAAVQGVSAPARGGGLAQTGLAFV